MYRGLVWLLLLGPWWGNCFCQRMLCLCNSFKISLSPCSGMAGMRKWLLILVQGWRNLLGVSRAEEVPGIRMLSAKHWSFFVFPAGVMGGVQQPHGGEQGQAPVCNFCHPGPGEAQMINPPGLLQPV